MATLPDSNGLNPLTLGNSQKSYTGSKGSEALSTILQHYSPLTQEAIDDLVLTEKGSMQAAEAADKLDLFLKHDANPNLSSQNGIKPLARAIENDRPDLFNKLLARPDIGINGLSNEGSSPLDMALAKGNKEAFIRLYERLSSEERLEKTYMPRLVAGVGKQKDQRVYVFPDCYSVIKDDFEKMGSKQSRAKYGTPILVKALRTNPDIFHWLLEQPEASELVKQSNAFSTKALNAAIQSSQSKTVIEKLLKLGADPLSPDVCGYSPLKWCAYSGQPEILELLLDQKEVQSKLKSEKIEELKQSCQKTFAYMKYRPVSEIDASQNLKNHELVVQAVQIGRGGSDPKNIIPYLTRGADVNGHDYTSELGYKGGHGSPISFARDNPELELILTEAGVLIGNCGKDKAYYYDLIKKLKELRRGK